MSRITVLNQANAPQGPFTRAEVGEKLQRGEFTLDSLAHVEGLTQWTPLRDVLARVDGTPAMPPVPVPAPAVPAPGTLPPAYSYAATMEPPAHLVYAGFWLRVGAWLIDAFIVGAVNVAIVLTWGVVVGVLFGTKLAAYRKDPSTIDVATTLLVLLFEAALVFTVVLIVWLYHALLESSPWQGTLGKRALGLRVTGMSGERIGFWHATARFFSRFVSFAFVGVGFLMAGFTERKQALHDMIVNTLVVRG